MKNENVVAYIVGYIVAFIVVFLSAAFVMILLITAVDYFVAIGEIPKLMGWFTRVSILILTIMGIESYSIFIGNKIDQLSE